MLHKNWHKHAPLQTRLIGERQMLSLMEKEIAVIVGDLVEDRENWVHMWIDTGHIVTSDDGAIKAFRGIDFDGKLMWMVRHSKKKYGYHSRRADPFDAIAEATTAWANRRRVRARWGLVENIARDLILGRKSFDVTRADAHRSALCGAGIDAFMKRIGAAKRDRLGGRTAALLMLVDPQIGFAIYAAYERVQSEMQSQPAHSLHDSQQASA
jgi:hypothetical protein